MAAQAEVSTLALTDHDTLGGVAEAQTAGDQLGVRVIAGIELSVRHRPGTFHLLGYFTEPAPNRLVARLDALAEGRRQRAAAILAKLEALGKPLGFDDVADRADGPIGRPHIADAMVDAGYVSSRLQAFERYLGNGGPAYVAIPGLEPAQAVALIASSGGAPVLAHPYSLGVGMKRMRSIIQASRDAGMVGIEVHRPDHTPDQFHMLRKLARQLGLLACGGSDFHRVGDDRALGDTGTPPLPPVLPDQLLDHCQAPETSPR